MPEFAGIDPVFAPLIQSTGEIVRAINNIEKVPQIINVKSEIVQDIEFEQVTPIIPKCPNCQNPLKDNRCDCI